MLVWVQMRQRALLFLFAVVLLAGIAGVAVADAAQVDITISGMHCEGCATGIQTMLLRTDGVLKAEVSYDERRAVVQYDASKTSPEKLVAVIEKMGYKAKLKK